jgi:AcrR family transcriptional regulator
MPKVSQAHIVARRRQILDAARECFAANGFHQTSMQDVFNVSRLSAGAVYRYFKSKEELVVAVVEDSVSQVEAALVEALKSDPLPPLDQVMGQFFAGIDKRRGDPATDPSRIALQAWSESVRDPVLGVLMGEVYGRMVACFMEIARRAKDAGQLPADADVQQVGWTLAVMGPGSIVLGLVLTGRTPNAADLSGGLAALLDARRP